MRPSTRLAQQLAGDQFGRLFAWPQHDDTVARIWSKLGMHTLEAVIKHGGFLYSSDSYNDVLPYWVKVGRTPHLIIPYTLENTNIGDLVPGSRVNIEFDLIGKYVERILSNK